MQPTIPKRVRDEVHQLALDLVNATILEEDGKLAYEKREVLLGYLDQAICRYGECIYLLAIKGDFLDDREERETVYNAALAQAIPEGNHDEVFLIQDSLLQMYLNEEMMEEFGRAFRFCRIYAEQNGQEANPDYVSIRDEFGPRMVGV